MSDAISEAIGRVVAQLSEEQLQSIIGAAQRLQQDEMLGYFLSEIRSTASHFAVFSTTPEDREICRGKVMGVDELRGTLKTWASMNQDRLEDDARAKSLE